MEAPPRPSLGSSFDVCRGAIGISVFYRVRPLSHLMIDVRCLPLCLLKGSRRRRLARSTIVRRREAAGPDKDAVSAPRISRGYQQASSTFRNRPFHRDRSVEDVFHWLRASRISSTATSTVPIRCRNSSRIWSIRSRDLCIRCGSRLPVTSCAITASSSRLASVVETIAVLMLKLCMFFGPKSMYSHQENPKGCE